MTFKKIVLFGLAVLILSFSAAGCNLLPFGNIRVTEIKMAPALGDDLMPINETDTFQKGVQKVYCWFSWQNAEVNTQIIAKWRYTTQNISIINHAFTLPRKDGSGSVLLTMPEGKVLPSGSYRVDLVMDKRVIKSRKFSIE